MRYYGTTPPPHNDVEVSLTMTECTCEKRVASGPEGLFLSGGPQKPFYDLPAVDIKHYAKLKREILTHLELTLAVWGHRLQCWKYHVGQSPRYQMQDLLQLSTKWLLKKLKGPQIMEQVVMDTT